MLLARFFSKSPEQIKSDAAARLLNAIKQLNELIKEFQKPENNSARIAADKDQGDDGGCWGLQHSEHIKKLRKKYDPAKITFDSALDKYQEIKANDSFELKQAFSELYKLIRVIEKIDPLKMTPEMIKSIDLRRIINLSELRELQNKISPYIEIELKKIESAPSRNGPTYQEMI